MSIKFIHAADLHIDSPMRILSSEDPVAGRRIQTATRDALSELVRVAIERNVSFVVIAGDLFDNSWDSVETGVWTSAKFRELDGAGIPVYIVHGNHDKKSATLPNMVFPGNVRFFSDAAPERFVEEFEDASRGTFERVALTGQSYRSEKCKTDLASNFPSAEPDAFNIGVLHTDLGTVGSSDYAPTSLDALNDKRYRYWALGHVHVRKTVQTTPSWIGWSGVLQPRHVNEATDGGFYLVEVENGKMVGEPERVSCDGLRWFHCKLDLKGIDDQDGLKERFLSAMDAIVEDESLVRSDGTRRFAAVRLTLTGRTNLFKELVRRGGVGKGKGRGSNSSLGTDLRSDLFVPWLGRFGRDLWLEDVKLEIRPPVEEVGAESGVFAEIKRDAQARIARYRDPNFDLEQDDYLADLETLADLRAVLKDVASSLPKIDKLDLFSPEQIARWREKALDIIADEIYCATDDANLT